MNPFFSAGGSQLLLRRLGQAKYSYPLVDLEQNEDCQRMGLTCETESSRSSDDNNDNDSTKDEGEHEQMHNSNLANKGDNNPSTLSVLPLCALQFLVQSLCRAENPIAQEYRTRGGAKSFQIKVFRGQKTTVPPFPPFLFPCLKGYLERRLSVGLRPTLCGA